MDAIERAGAGAGQVHLEHAAKLIEELAHQLDLAGTCSDLCAISSDTIGLLGKLAWSIASTHQNARTKVAQASSPYRIRECGNVVFLERDRA